MLDKQAELPCPLVPAVEGDEAVLVLWYKGKSTVPIYRLVESTSAIDVHWLTFSIYRQTLYIVKSITMQMPWNFMAAGL